MTDATRDQIASMAIDYADRHLTSLGTWNDKAAAYRAGAEAQHPISYSQGLAEGRRQAVEEIGNRINAKLSGLKQATHGRVFITEVNDLIKKELEKLKGK